MFVTSVVGVPVGVVVASVVVGVVSVGVVGGGGGVCVVGVGMDVDGIVGVVMVVVGPWCSWRG